MVDVSNCRKILDSKPDEEYKENEVRRMWLSLNLFLDAVVRVEEHVLRHYAAERFST